MNLGTPGDPIQLTREDFFKAADEVAERSRQEIDQNYAFVWHPTEKTWWTAKMNPDGTAKLIRRICDPVDENAV